MRSRSQNVLENLLDYLSQQNENECFAIPCHELVNIADRPTVRAERRRSATRRAIQIVRLLQLKLEEKGYWTQGVRASHPHDAPSKMGQFYCPALGKTGLSVRTWANCHFGLSECQAMIAGPGRPVVGYVIGNGPAEWPAAAAIATRQRGVKCIKMANDRMARLEHHWLPQPNNGES